MGPETGSYNRKKTWIGAKKGKFSLGNLLRRRGLYEEAFSLGGKRKKK